MLAVVYLLAGLAAVVAGVAGLAGLWWALVAAGVGLVALGVLEARGEARDEDAIRAYVAAKAGGEAR